MGEIREQDGREGHMLVMEPEGNERLQVVSEDHIIRSLTTKLHDWSELA